MLTKKDYLKFVSDVRIIRYRYNYEMFLFGQRILEVYSEAIITGSASEPPTRYTYEESLQETTSLRGLYDSIRIQPLSLRDIYKIKGLREWEKEHLKLLATG